MKRILIFALITAALTASSFDKRVNLHGGITKSKRAALWKVQKYRDTKLLRRPPLCYTPYTSYCLVDKYVEVKTVDNQSALVIKADIADMVVADARYNFLYAQRFHGRNVKAIYKYCKRTKYVLYRKSARSVFQYRRGDCAGIASAFYVACRVSGIPVRYVIGWDGIGCHAWNRVKWKGKWYWIDCTYGEYLTRRLWPGFSVMESW